MSLRHASVSISALALGALLGLSACASEARTTTGPVETGGPLAAEISNEMTATADVVAVDKAQRLVTLRGDDGRLVDVRASDAVRNFDQIKAGDTLRVKYRQSLAARRLPSGSDPGLVGGGVTANRAKAGDRPAGGVGALVSLRVKIVSVDRSREVVVFSLPSGELVAHRIATPQGREFVKGLAVDDLVQLDYAEALALSIETL
jgi:hypothetical protein